MKIQITGGRVIDPANQLDAHQDLYISAGKIVALGSSPAGFVADQVIDASGQIVCPGLIDLQAHLREPGDTRKGTIASESAAAVAGGVTTLCCPPSTLPVLDSTAVARLIQDKADQVGLARVLPLGALTRGLEGGQLSNMVALQEAGCVALANARHPIASTQTLMRCMEYAATFDVLLMLHAKDADLTAGGCAHDGITCTRLGLPGIPETAETLDVARCLLLAEQTGVRLHLCQLSAQRSVQLVRDAQQRGVAVTADVAIPYLFLCDEDLDGFSSDYHLDPPLRDRCDMAGLREGLASGVITAICSDHQPQDAAAKEAPFASTEPGMIGLETLLPLTLRLVEDNVLTLDEAIRKLTAGPAAVLGLDLGHLSVGVSADICIFDPQAQWSLTQATTRSKGLNSPFMDAALTGQVTCSLLKGRVVYTR